MTTNANTKKVWLAFRCTVDMKEDLIEYSKKFGTESASEIIRNRITLCPIYEGILNIISITLTKEEYQKIHNSLSLKEKDVFDEFLP